MGAVLYVVAHLGHRDQQNYEAVGMKHGAARPVTHTSHTDLHFTALAMLVLEPCLVAEIPDSERS